MRSQDRGDDMSDDEWHWDSYSRVGAWLCLACAVVTAGVLVAIARWAIG
jgi:hypothetical protein